MFPKSRENTVAVISEQLGAYREIRERVEDLEKRIKMLMQSMRRIWNLPASGRIKCAQKQSLNI